MRKRLLLLAGVVLAAAVMVPAVRELHAYRHRLARGRLIDAEHYDRIKKGMSETEVEAILGGPPGDFATENILYLDPPGGASEVGGERWEFWSGNEGEIAVAFDEQGVARRPHLEKEGVRLPPLSLTERVRAWLRRLWP